MSLRFFNESRSYDPTRRPVRFWGHDSAMEASFFVGEDALKRVQPAMRFDAAGLLGAFDANRDLIGATAAKVMREGAKVLITCDFRLLNVGARSLDWTGPNCASRVVV
jgi:hypothetical protein